MLGLGFLGVVAGAVVTYRRQQTMQDQLDHEKDKFAREQVRETERRQPERYAQGAQMLADESPAVRIAGLNVIAALGREVAPEEELRQTCLNLVCAYLRASSPASLRPSQEGRQEEPPLPDDPYRVAAARRHAGCCPHCWKRSTPAATAPRPHTDWTWISARSP